MIPTQLAWRQNKGPLASTAVAAGRPLICENLLKLIYKIQLHMYVGRHYAKYCNGGRRAFHL